MIVTKKNLNIEHKFMSIGGHKNYDKGTIQQRWYQLSWFYSLWLLYTMTLLSFFPGWTGPFFTQTLPFHFYPGFLWPFLILPFTSHPLLPQLPWCHVIVHVPMIANPNIAKVIRLASLFLSSSTPSFLSIPVKTYTWPGLHPRHSLSCAYSGITRYNTKLRHQLPILPYLRSSWITIQSADLLGNLGTFLLWLWSLLGSLQIYQDHL